MSAARGPYIPSADGLNAEFYEHAQGGVLHLQRCGDCGSFNQPPRYLCTSCGSGELTWVPSPGRGTLFSWAITHRAYDRGWADRLPYITGVIELEEGVRLVGALEGVERDELVLGLPLQTRLDPRNEEFVFITLILA
jgi:uncharacterized OB-fold protein